MKRLLFIAFTACVFSACHNNDTTSPASTTDTTTTAVPDNTMVKPDTSKMSSADTGRATLKSMTADSTK